MPTRHYQFRYSGRIAVDDTTLKAAFLAFTFDGSPGVPDLTPEEGVEMREHLLSFVEGLTADKRMQAFLANAPFHGFDDRLTRMVQRGLPGADVQVDGIRVTVVEGGVVGRP